jgi:endoglucanase
VRSFAAEVLLATLLQTTVASFHGQRCGTAVDLGSGYKHDACHRRAAFHPSAQAISKILPVSKGWHDAGDYGRYVVNSGITVGTLLWAWELYPDQFRDIDLLGEVRWNLEWMLSMQDDDGGVWHKQTSLAFPGFVMPHHDESISYVIGKGSCATANLAAVSAIAARVYEKHDVEFAQRNLGAATRAWIWLKKNPNVAFRNPPDVTTGEYGDRDCSDERLWAAAELWRTAKDADAGTWLRANIGGATSHPASWNSVGPMALWSYALGGDAEARRKSIAAADEVVARAATDPWRIPMTKLNFVWGSNGGAANYGVQLLVANELKPDRRYVDAAQDILRYLLGRNPFSMSYVTGVGERSAMHPHHRPSIADGIDAPWPGLLVGGPNRNRQDAEMKARLPEGTQPIRMYLDHQESYATNENAINWNAALVFLIAGVEEGTREN